MGRVSREYQKPTQGQNLGQNRKIAQLTQYEDRDCQRKAS